MNCRRATLLLGIAAAGLAAATALAQDEHSRAGTSTSSSPTRPAAGSTIFARLIGAKLSDRLGKPVVIENRAGANGNLAAAQVTKSPPDGHTLLLGSIGMLTVNPAVVANLIYDTRSAISRRSR